MYDRAQRMQLRRRVAALSAVVVGVLMLVAIYPAFSVRTRDDLNLLIVTLDTTRADRLGAYGSSAKATPAFDRIAAEGVLFQRAVTAVPLTLPSHATIFTGRYPPAHGVR